MECLLIWEMHAGLSMFWGCSIKFQIDWKEIIWMIFSNFNCSCDNFNCMSVLSEDVSNFNALEGSKDWKHLRALAEKQLKSLALCSAKHLLVHCVSGEMFWIVQVAFSCSVCGGFLTIHFNLITIRDELLLCCGRR